MSRRSVLRLAMSSALAAAACAHSRDFRCSAEGGPQWVEVESAHFRIVTDAQADEARRLGEEYEQVRQAMLAGAWESRFDPPGRLEVVVLRNRDELGEFTGTPRGGPGRKVVAGYFQPWGRPRIVTGLAHDRDAPSLVLPPFRSGIEAAAQAKESLVLKHELAHYLALHVLLRQPRWLSEGLATYLQTVVVGTYQGKPAAVVGFSPTLEQLELLGLEPVSAGKLLRGEDFDYLWSGLFVHWLVNQRAGQFADYQQRLARAEEPLAAWKAAFPQLDPADAAAMEALDRVLADYVKAARFTVRRVMLTAAASPGRERTLAPAEVHALRSELFVAALVDRTERARAELAESLREDPSGSSAVVPLFFLRPGDELLDKGQRIETERPGDWRGGLLVALGASERSDLAAERLAGLRDVARAMPDDAFALNAAAWELLRLGASGEALPLAARAAALAPWSVAVLDTYGAVLADLGWCREALSAQHRAVDLLGRREGAGGQGDGEPGEVASPEPGRAEPGERRDVAAEVRKRLEEIEAGCHPAQPPTRG